MGNQRGRESFNPGDPKASSAAPPVISSATRLAHTRHAPPAAPRPLRPARRLLASKSRTLSCDTLPFRFLLNYHILSKASPPAGSSPLYLLAVSRTPQALPALALVLTAPRLGASSPEPPFLRLELEEGLPGTSPCPTTMTPLISAVASITSCKTLTCGLHCPSGLLELSSLRAEICVAMPRLPRPG